MSFRDELAKLIQDPTPKSNLDKVKQMCEQSAKMGKQHVSIPYAFFSDEVILNLIGEGLSVQEVWVNYGSSRQVEYIVSWGNNNYA